MYILCIYITYMYLQSACTFHCIYTLENSDYRPPRSKNRKINNRELNGVNETPFPPPKQKQQANNKQTKQKGILVTGPRKGGAAMNKTTAAMLFGGICGVDDSKQPLLRRPSSSPNKVCCACHPLSSGLWLTPLPQTRPNPNQGCPKKKYLFRKPKPNYLKIENWKAKNLKKTFLFVLTTFLIYLIYK